MTRNISSQWQWQTSSENKQKLGSSESTIIINEIIPSFHYNERKDITLLLLLRLCTILRFRAVYLFISFLFCHFLARVWKRSVCTEQADSTEFLVSHIVYCTREFSAISKRNITPRLEKKNVDLRTRRKIRNLRLRWIRRKAGNLSRSGKYRALFKFISLPSLSLFFSLSSLARKNQTGI